MSRNSSTLATRNAIVVSTALSKRVWVSKISKNITAKIWNSSLLATWVRMRPSVHHSSSAKCKKAWRHTHQSILLARNLRSEDSHQATVNARSDQRQLSIPKLLIGKNTMGCKVIVRSALQWEVSTFQPRIHKLKMHNCIKPYFIKFVKSLAEFKKNRDSLIQVHQQTTDIRRTQVLKSSVTAMSIGNPGVQVLVEMRFSSIQMKFHRNNRPKENNRANQKRGGPWISHAGINCG